MPAAFAPLLPHAPTAQLPLVGVFCGVLRAVRRGDATAAIPFLPQIASALLALAVPDVTAELCERSARAGQVAAAASQALCSFLWKLPSGGVLDALVAAVVRNGDSGSGVGGVGGG